VNRQELEHLLRASGRIIGETQFIIIGSQSILGKHPDAPEKLLWSMEADFIAKNKPKETEKLNSIGELSPFHSSHGYYVDPVDERTATLPKGWKGRLVNLSSENTNGVTGLCLDPHDLFVSKIAANRPKDIEFCQIMIEHGMVGKDRVIELAKTITNPENDLDKSRRVVARIEGLYNGVDISKSVHINENSGLYIGKILSISDTIVQQDLGRGKVVFHEASRIDKNLMLGRSYTIQYKAGIGHVSEKNLDNGLSR
jgi:hypothetical protein